MTRLLPNGSSYRFNRLASSRLLVDSVVPTTARRVEAHSMVRWCTLVNAAKNKLRVLSKIAVNFGFASEEELATVRFPIIGKKQLCNMVVVKRIN